METNVKKEFEGKTAEELHEKEELFVYRNKIFRLLQNLFTIYLQFYHCVIY